MAVIKSVCIHLNEMDIITTDGRKNKSIGVNKNINLYVIIS